MTIHLGDVPAGSTLYIPFCTYDANGASVTLTGLAVTDVEIYKNGGTTQRASDAGYALLDTDGIDFDGVTGLHGFSVDLSDNTDAGFFSVGGFYWVVVSTVTIASQTVTLLAATFRIVAAESSAGVPKADVSHIAGSSVSTSTAQLGVNVVNAGGTAWGSGAITAASIASDAITAAKIADGAIDAGAIADNAITSAKIAADAIGASQIADNAIDAGAIAANAITAAKIADGAIDAATFAANAITSTVIANDAITAAKIATDAIDADALAADALAEINAQVVDGLATDTYAEPGQGSPGATISLAAKIGYLYKAWRNRHTQTASEYALFADDGSTKDHEAAVSDDGTTFVRAEVTTGA
jgi:hypothetical protein